MNSLRGFAHHPDSMGAKKEVLADGRPDTVMSTPRNEPTDIDGSKPGEEKGEPKKRETSFKYFIVRISSFLFYLLFLTPTYGSITVIWPPERMCYYPLLGFWKAAESAPRVQLPHVLMCTHKISHPSPYSIFCISHSYTQLLLLNT